MTRNLVNYAPDEPEFDFRLTAEEEAIDCGEDNEELARI
jgi:hypothetical protein